jgi:hypothetical protein
VVIVSASIPSALPHPTRAEATEERAPMASSLSASHSFSSLPLLSLLGADTDRGEVGGVVGNGAIKKFLTCGFRDQKVTI